MDRVIDKPVKKTDTVCEELKWINTNLPSGVAAIRACEVNPNFNDISAELDTFNNKHFKRGCESENLPSKTQASAIAYDVKAVEEKKQSAPGGHHSIFDFKRDDGGHTIVTLPQILTVYETKTNKVGTLKEDKHSTLPLISDTNPTQINSTKKVGLFDFRAGEIQRTARKKQIRKLKRQGYGTRSDSNSPSRFITRPYEGSCDDVSKFKDISPVRRLPKIKSGESSLGSSTEEISTKNDNVVSSMDEITLRKIEIAYQQWEERNLGKNPEISVRDRKRSSSHSPVRSSHTQEKGSISGNRRFLNFHGNLRRETSAKSGNKESGTGRTYRAIASPACFRRQINHCPSTATSNTVIKTSITPLAESGQNRISNLLLSDSNRNCEGTRYRTKISLRNRIPTYANFPESSLSESLPNLTSTMNNKGHRPRTSSLNKHRVSSARSSKVSSKQLSKHQGENKVAKSENDAKLKNAARIPSPSATRRVVVNTFLPTASPTFQRAMKGMTIPEKDYSEIFEKDRRDSILQSYSIAENAQKSFFDDHDLKGKESRDDKLEEMTNQFRKDIIEYKDGWNSNVTGVKKKSILKNRRQSVDDLDISTRKNLAKYLESKLDIN